MASSIEILQDIARASTKNIDDFIFVDNWIPWFAVLFFAIGWFMVHWIESALLKRQTKTAIILFVTLLLEAVVFNVYFHWFVEYYILQLFGLVTGQLIYSGAFLRYSVFSKEAFIAMGQIVFGAKLVVLRQG